MTRLRIVRRHYRPRNLEPPQAIPDPSRPDGAGPGAAMTPDGRATGTIAPVDERLPGTEPAAPGVEPAPSPVPSGTGSTAREQPSTDVATSGTTPAGPGSSFDLAPKDDPEADEIPLPPPTMPSTAAFGATIGFGLVDISARGRDPGFSAVIGMVIGAVIGAGGVAVVAVLVLRTMGDWAKHPARGPDALPDRPKPPA
jgi:hypothetical protein